MCAHSSIEMEAIDVAPVIKVISGVVFATCSDLQSVAGAVALQASNVRRRIFGGQGRVFARSLLAAAPSGVSEYVDVRAPVCETCHSSIVHSSSFIRDHLPKKKTF